MREPPFALMSLRKITAGVLSWLLVVPALIDAGCAARGPDVNGAISTLASAGVATYETYGSSTPIVAISGTRSAMRFTRWQLKNMLLQADAGMGMTGAELDRLEGANPPKNAPTMSQFVAAWVMKYQSPLAAYAKAHIGVSSIDLKRTKQTVFPLLVIGLFVADVARMSDGTPPKVADSEPGFERFIAAPAQAYAICSAVSNFVNGIIGDVEAALKEIPYAGKVLVYLWGALVDVVKTAINKAIAPILAVISAVSAGLAAITTIASTLSPWVVKLAAKPQSVNLSDQTFRGFVDADVVSGAIDWPEEVSDCAQQLSGIDLASISSEDAPVTWEPGGEIPLRADVDTKNTEHKLRKNSVRFVYVTKPLQNVPPETCRSYDPAGKIEVGVKIERVDVQHLATQLANLAFGKINTTAYQHLKGYFQKYIDSAMQSIENYIHSPALGHGSVELKMPVYDTSLTGCGTPTPTATPTATPDETSLEGAWICTVDTTTNGHELGAFKVEVNTLWAFTKTTLTTTAYQGTKMYGHYIYNGPGTGAAVSHSGSYSYAPSGASAGTLTAGNKVIPITWNGTSEWHAVLTNPLSGKSYATRCHH